MFKEFKTMFENIIEVESQEKKQIKMEISVCEQELKQVNFEMESFIKLVHGSSNQGDNEKLGKELERITEREKSLKMKLEELKNKLETEKSKK